MELFSSKNIEPQNLLPGDGMVQYHGSIFSAQQANDYFNILLHTIDWKNDEVMMFGKRIVTRRKVAWYGASDLLYTYSNTTKKALPWTPALLQLKAAIKEVTGETYNSCLLNLYHTGDEAMAWHADDEKELKKDGAIASLSFGAERMFAFKHKTTQEKVSLLLQHGSLLLMKGTTQTHWLHSLLLSKRIATPRINLTFRTIVG